MTPLSDLDRLDLPARLLFHYSGMVRGLNIQEGQSSHRKRFSLFLDRIGLLTKRHPVVGEQHLLDLYHDIPEDDID